MQNKYPPALGREPDHDLVRGGTAGGRTALAPAEPDVVRDIGVNAVLRFVPPIPSGRRGTDRRELESKHRSTCDVSRDKGQHDLNVAQTHLETLRVVGHNVRVRLDIVGAALPVPHRAPGNAIVIAADQG